MKRITVVLAEDHEMVRECLKILLEAERDIEVIGEAVTGRQAIDITWKLRPAVVVMDLSMPLLNGLEATRQIRQLVPDTKVLILSAYSDDSYVENAMASGAAGYLIKQTPAHFLSEAIREVHKGHTFFSSAIAKKHHHHQETVLNLKGRPQPRFTGLTSREVEVLQLIAEGAANKQVAVALGISVKTVEKHRDHLMQKLDIHDTAGLTRYAIAEGII
jgi:DNA-binding NarL/FixJ family response regulator